MVAIRTKGAEMSATAAVEARGRLEVILGPLPPGEKLKSMLPSLAHRLGMKCRRVRALWACEAKRIDSDEMDLLRAAAAQAEANRAAQNLDGAANALLALGTDEDRAAANRLRRLADQLRGETDHPGNGR